MKNWHIATMIVIAILLSGVGAYLVRASQTGKQSQTSTTASNVSNSSSTTSTTSSSMSSNNELPVGPSLISSVENWETAISGYSYPPNFLAFDPNSSLIYVSGGPSNLVTIVNARTHDVTGTFAVPGIYAGPVSVDPRTNNLLVWVDTCDVSNHNISTCDPNDIKVNADLLNGTTYQTIREFPVADGAFAVDFTTENLYVVRNCPNPEGSVLFPDFANCGFLYSYDLDSGVLTSNVSLKEPSYVIAVNPRTNAVYTVATDQVSDYQFLIINGTTNKVEANTSASFQDSTPQLQVNVNTDTVFALGANGSVIIASFNGTTGRIIYSAPIVSGCSVDSNRFYVNQVTNEIYGFGYTKQANYFLIINASDGRLLNMLSMQEHVYEDSTYDFAQNEIYLLLDGQLDAIPSQMTQTYTNASLLSSPPCPVPIG